MEIIVIGASNVDIIGKSNKKFELKTSNIGNVSIEIGGVGRNIAEQLCQLGAEVELITVITESFFGELIKLNLFEKNIGFVHSVFVDYEDSIYVSLEDESGEMIGSVNQMNNIELLTPEIIKEKFMLIGKSEIVAIDTNLSMETIEYIANCKNRGLLAVEGVSTQKVKKIIPIIDKIDLLKVNEYEAKSLIQNYSDESEEQIVKMILEKGIKEVHMTLGESGVIVGSKEGIQHFTVEKVKRVKSVNQVGDTYFAGIVYQTLKQKLIEEKVKFASDLARKKLIGDKTNVE